MSEELMITIKFMPRFLCNVNYNMRHVRGLYLVNLHSLEIFQVVFTGCKNDTGG